MAKRSVSKPAPRNGRGRLEEALGALIQNEAAFLNRQADIERRQAETERRHAEAMRLLSGFGSLTARRIDAHARFSSPQRR
jgi:hypothetical protein